MVWPRGENKLCRDACSSAEGNDTANSELDVGSTTRNAPWNVNLNELSSVKDRIDWTPMLQVEELGPRGRLGLACAESESNTFGLQPLS